ncbi:SDR family oxidoreductase [Lujinxingia vulgaris]|uniref:SDR family oxidoreductase n=1 Tax=Lujinxingia vulgaris TaxID=2600176 RepID=A0A5C6XCM3_9DELT|nr:glucose 1-dehydrogenase [Lujinxingia vulgaris]TXD37031.1 SDR family oxidoreductase [Lujinxingia vulgaris]
MTTKHQRVAWVTGGAQGIGRAISEALVDEGVRVCVVDRDREAGEEMLEELGSPETMAFWEVDVSDEKSVAGAMDQTIERFGRLDVLVNNAGVAQPHSGPIESLSLEDWNRWLDTNLTGAFLCAKHAVPHLRCTSGSIVNMASTRAYQSEANSEAYAASKGGLVALTHAMAMSLGPEIRVNSVSPGWIEVSEWKKRSERERPQLRPEDHAQHPVGRVGKPEDVAELVVFLTGPRAEFITGQDFVIDGGMTRKMIYED